jgi:MFS family permease
VSAVQAGGLSKKHLIVMVAAAAVLMITMGMRQTTGLYINPMMDSTHIAYASMSFALAVGQLMWGAAQPIFGAMAERHGAWRVLVIGALLLSAGYALTPFVDNKWAVLVTFGVLTAAGAGAGSFAVLIGQVALRVPAHKRSLASGFVNAGGSLGQFVFAPVTQALISAFGWMSAMWTMAVAALATLPLARPLLGKVEEPAQIAGAAPAPAPITLREQLRIAARDKSYWLLHAGFFTCGFHIAFLVTHLPGEVGGVMRMKWLLFIMYFSRAAAVLIYLAAPKSAETFYIFAAVLGFTWLATVPPTAGLIGKLFGVRYLATLFGLATFTHQIGAFFGAYLGGIALTKFGDFTWMWYADAALAAAAAFINLPIREAKLKPALAPA